MYSPYLSNLTAGTCESHEFHVHSDDICPNVWLLDNDLYFFNNLPHGGGIDPGTICPNVWVLDNDETHEDLGSVLPADPVVARRCRKRSAPGSNLNK